MYFSRQQQEIYGRLRNSIIEGDYTSGTGFPKEVDLAKQFQVARNTLRPCLERLVEDGLVVRIKRKGTFVSKGALNLLKYKTIGLLMPGLGADLTLTQSPANYLIFDGIQKYCLETSWDIQIMQRKCESVSLERISQSNISGLIIVMPNRTTYELIADLKKHEIPFLCINLHSAKVNKEVNFVNLDYYNTTIDAVKYLYKKGRRSIGIVGTHKIREDSHISHVVRGYRKTIKELNLKEKIITSDTENVLKQELLPGFFRNNMESIKECDAIITVLNAGEAMNLFNILKKEKIKVPEEISLISFFENEESIKAKITSYSPDLQALGYKSASLFNEILNDENKNIKQLSFKLDLFSRLSA